MNNQDHYRMKPIEMGISLMSFLFGVNILILPRTLAIVVDTSDGWIAVLISGLLSMAWVWLYVRLQGHFDNQTLFQYMNQGAVSKWVSKILVWMMITYFLIVTAFIVRFYSIVVRLYLLDRTPPEMIVMLLLLVTTYAVSKGVQGMIHLNLMFIPIIIAILLFMFAMNLPEAEFSQMAPILPRGITPVLQGIVPTVFGFAGVFMIVFWLPYMDKEKMTSAPINMAMLITTIFFIITVVYSFTIFSVDMNKILVFPTVELAKEIEIPGGFFERLESLMITGWTMAIFTSIAMNKTFIFQLLRMEVFQKGDGPWVRAGVVFSIFILSFIPNSVSELLDWSRWLAIWVIGIVVIILISGYWTVWTRHVKNGQMEQ